MTSETCISLPAVSRIAMGHSSQLIKNINRKRRRSSTNESFPVISAESELTRPLFGYGSAAGMKAFSNTGVIVNKKPVLKRHKILDLRNNVDSEDERLRLCQQMNLMKEMYNLESDENAIMSSSSEEE